jgi:hypothetical protein
VLQESHGVEGPAGPRSFISAVPYPSAANDSFTPLTTPSSRSQLGGGCRFTSPTSAAARRADHAPDRLRVPVTPGIPTPDRPHGAACDPDLLRTLRPRRDGRRDALASPGRR